MAVAEQLSADMPHFCQSVGRGGEHVPFFLLGEHAIVLKTRPRRWPTSTASEAHGPQHSATGANDRIQVPASTCIPCQRLKT